MHDTFNDTTPLPPPRFRSVDAERIAQAGRHLHRVPMPYEPASVSINYERHTASDASAEGCAGEDDMPGSHVPKAESVANFYAGLVAVLAVVFTLVHIGARLF